MSFVDTLLEILKYTIPAVVVLIATSAIVNKFLKTETRKKQLEVYQEGLKTSLTLRLQAYERLTVFLERIQPRAIIPRLYQQGMRVSDLQFALITAIKQEFEHNLSQQVYVSGKIWHTVVTVKEQQLSIINQLAAGLQKESSAKLLHQKILEHYASEEEDKLPIDMALELIQNEAKIVLSSKG